MITIYHYTSIETLKLILKNQTLRFKSLGYVDDPNEQKTSDFGTIGSFNYVSCWKTQYDNIPQWNMYGDDCKGAMIAISFNTVLDVFETEKFSFDGESLVDILPLLNPLKTPVTPTNGYLPDLISMEYTDDKSLINPKVVSVEEKTTNIDLTLNGKYKTTKWDFQKEHRFSISVLPWSLSEIYEILKEQGENFGNYMFRALPMTSPKLEYFDINLNSNIFKNTQILFGPKCCNENKKEIQDLLHSLNLDIPCNDSEILIR